MSYRLAVSLLLIISTKTFCRVLQENEVKVILPDQLEPKKEAFFFQRQLVILLVPSALGGLGGLGGVGGLPIGGLPYGAPATGFNARNTRVLERMRAIRRRNRIKSRSTTASYDSGDSDSK